MKNRAGTFLQQKSDRMKHVYLHFIKNTLKLLREMIHDVSFRLKISNEEIGTLSLTSYKKECARQVEII